MRLLPAPRLLRLTPSCHVITPLHAHLATIKSILSAPHAGQRIDVHTHGSCTHVFSRTYALSNGARVENSRQPNRSCPGTDHESQRGYRRKARHGLSRHAHARCMGISSAHHAFYTRCSTDELGAAEQPKDRVRRQVRRGYRTRVVHKVIRPPVLGPGVCHLECTRPTSRGDPSALFTQPIRRLWPSMRLESCRR